MMRIFANNKIKKLFMNLIVIILTFTIVEVACLFFAFNYKGIVIVFCSLIEVLLILCSCYLYFYRENKDLEEAVNHLRDYMSGNKQARISCNEEGEIYRLFHEVNMLTSILNTRAENELQEKTFLKETISNISHQLKTPLAALNIYNGILQDTEDMETIQEFTTMSEKELDRIETLVQSLLKIAKLDAGTVIFEKKQENVLDLMTSISNHFSYRVNEEKKELIINGDETAFLNCDKTWLIEAIENIVKNALDHTKEGNCISIEWKQFASSLKITVKDNGSGIHQEDLLFIFKRFYRSRFKTDMQGIGLGLPLAKSIIEAHDGTIEVSSELGVGTTFILNFLNPL